VKLSDLVKGFTGHPLHPPLTDATIGAYTAATALGGLGALGVSEGNLAKGWWLALVVGMAVTGPTALTGLIDWLGISRGTPLWRTATAHMLAMLTATAFFLLATIVGYDGYAAGEVTRGGLTLTLIGFATLTLGGWLGGTVVFVHGMRVLNRVDEPALRAATPGHEESDRASGRRADRGEPRAGLTRH
jgi:uncharacterized membrane protein